MMNSGSAKSSGMLNGHELALCIHHDLGGGIDYLTLI